MPLLQVRDFPQELYERLAQTAKADKRSISQETIVLLQEALATKQGDRQRRQAVLDEIRRRPLLAGKGLPDPVTLVREDRDR